MSINLKKNRTVAIAFVVLAIAIIGLVAINQFATKAAVIWKGPPAEGFTTTNNVPPPINSGTTLPQSIAGPLGIGTTTPAEKLDVNGVLKLERTATAVLANKDYPAVYGAASNFLVNNATYNGALVLQSRSSSDLLPILFATGNPGTVKMMVSGGSGNVGIGTTNPAQKLEVATSGGNPQLRLTCSTAKSWDFYSYTDGNFYLNNQAGLTRLTVLDSGNVGINTSAPGAKLQINSPDNGVSPALSIRQDNATNYGWDFLEDTLFDGNFYLNRVLFGVSTNVMTFDRAKGNVGIGTTNPKATLQVGNNVGLFQPSPGAATDLALTQNVYYVAPDWKSINNGPGALLYMSGGNSYFYTTSNVNADTKATLTPILDIKANGGVGIMTNGAPLSYNLQVNGNAWVTGNAWSGSDVRWKKYITPLKGSLDKVLALQGVGFEWDKADYPDKNFPDGKQIGFIAQDVEKVIPEVVTTDAQGYKGLAYDKLTAVLVEAIKEQQSQIDELKKEVEALKNK